MTALHVAARQPDSKALHYLLHRAAPNLTTPDGVSPQIVQVNLSSFMTLSLSLSLSLFIHTVREPSLASGRQVWLVRECEGLVELCTLPPE